LDHGHSLESVKKAISLGFKSVMIDGSALPFVENVKLTKAVVKYAHSKDVWVEAEIGVLCGHEDDVHSSTQMFTDPVQAKKFVEMTGCDSLAVAVGTSHGAYKGVGKLRFDILSAIHKLMPKMPLVLHGASQIPQKYTKILGLNKAAGIPEADIKKAITLGIRKVNVDSDSRLAWTSVMKILFSKKLETFDPRFFLGKASDEMKALYMREIRFMAFSNSKRADSESI
jgi:fructose-bisphosphate aldolase, class II